MSVIFCEKCQQHIDTDFNAEHEDECGKNFCAECGEECEGELCGECEEQEVFANNFG